jgi:putative transposase
MHKSSSGAVYSLKIHLVIVTKYRRKVINKAMHLKLEEIFDNTCNKWECDCLEFNTEQDHLHALIDVNPKVAPCKLVNSLKTVSSRLIRKEFADYLSGFYRKPVLWSIGYAVNSCGGVTLDKVKDYIKNQDNPL